MAEDTIKECVIFDIDGTLANCDHRRKYVDGTLVKDWEAFRRYMSADPVHEHVRRLYRMYLMNDWTILICTGRLEADRDMTTTWLMKAGISGYVQLMMRPDAERFRPDWEVKQDMLHQILDEGYTPVCSFDDRNRVVQMWRDNGVPCFQVNDGNF